ncbi:hypothetical protein [Bacillus sp. SG-1]|nr:hypothetical protein [Bacillus sp. SG-1]EDL64840.1 putative manganese-dependent inorganic pyrophosphatase [Bacillus sp. SG-1]
MVIRAGAVEKSGKSVIEELFKDMEARKDWEKCLEEAPQGRERLK